ncbi:hypothetical protein PENTCL1PPCAC_15160, partial [Pristionchus entomophagus]
MIYGIADVRIPTMASALAMMIVAIIPLYFVILHLRSMILKCLDDAGAFLSEKTMAMHSQFVKMLTLQCVVPPAVFLLTMVPNELEHYDVVRHPLVEAMINVLACLSTLLSPLIVLFHIVPYRRCEIQY